LHLQTATFLFFGSGGGGNSGAPSLILSIFLRHSLGELSGLSLLSLLL
jgi:hypothetical protein